VLILDFLTQNFLLGLYLLYFETNQFLNYQSGFVFTLLGLLYSIVTLLINFVSILSRRWSREHDSDQMGSKLLLAMLSLIQCHYLYIAFGPRFEKPMSYAYVAGMQSSQVAMRVCQNALYLMIGIVLIIDDIGQDKVAIMSFGFTGFQFVFNIIFLFVVTK
jgi:hypothetical protein